ncbi:MAG: 16S rRNA (guanine(527)-N(7))-methyltransferase RsmG [Chloroflexi bacterium]|nr:16S rRNA (guanine(527)-N(7))-methyltransferase RsmG [Chloroflexota bacterium]MDA1297504.1 16S rRNA (guanine(527)-N(7))-methyltransferase RsmG [Chloroflexota bacterium]
MERLCEAAESVGVSAGDEFRRAFTRYFELIEAANSRFNLTGARGWDRVRDELFIRSLRFLAPVAGGYVPAVEWFTGRRVLDVGTGAGIPGLVLKLAVPGMNLTLIEASRKKSAFVQEVVTDLGLGDTLVVTGRAEEVGRDRKHRETYDLVMSRGVARLAELAELTLPFAAVGGVVVAAKGQGVETELEESAAAAELMGAAPGIAATVSAPGTGAISPDTMVYWMKIGHTPAEYPRRNGVPHSRPIMAERGKSGMAPAR